MKRKERVCCSEIGELRKPVWLYLLLFAFPFFLPPDYKSQDQVFNLLWPSLLSPSPPHLNTGKIHLLQRMYSQRPPIFKNSHSSNLILAKHDRCFHIPVHVVLPRDKWISSYPSLGLPALNLCCSWLNFYFLIPSNFAIKWDYSP